MNVGEYLVSKSPLNSGTALAHLLAMRCEGGAVKTIFASQMVVCFETQVAVIQNSGGHSVKTNSANSVATPQNKPSKPNKPNHIAVQTYPARADVITQPRSMYIVLGPPIRVFIRTLPSTITSRRKRITE